MFKPSIVSALAIAAMGAPFAGLALGVTSSPVYAQGQTDLNATAIVRSLEPSAQGYGRVIVRNHIRELKDQSGRITPIYRFDYPYGAGKPIFRKPTTVILAQSTTPGNWPARILHIRAVSAAELPADVVIDTTRAIEFEVFFDFGSAVLKPEAVPMLHDLGEALSSETLKQHRFLIAGHTDAAGSETFNQELSLRRAEVVRNFLIEIYAIDPTRLVIAGFGESVLKDLDNPRSGINRRVEVALVLD